MTVTVPDLITVASGFTVTKGVRAILRRPIKSSSTQRLFVDRGEYSANAQKIAPLMWDLDYKKLCISRECEKDVEKLPRLCNPR